jgi:hypothetical protein
MLTSYLVGIICGLLIGVYVTRESFKEKKVQGGAEANALHYLGASLLSASTPSIIASVIGGLPFLQTFGVALTFFLLGGLALYAYAYFESKPVAAK